MLIHGDMISEYVNLYGEWCESEVFLYSLILGANSNVVEIGSNIGMHTVPLAKMCSKGTVICFEPQRAIFQILNANLALNNLLHVDAQRLAIGDSQRHIEIQATDYEQPWNYGSFSIGRGFSTENAFKGKIASDRVSMIALDQSAEVNAISALDLLKIDAEGSEKEVLKGAHKTIERYRPAIFVENNQKGKEDELIRMLNDLDYTPYWFLSKRYRRANYNKAAEFLSGVDANMICLPRERPMNPKLERVGLVKATDAGQLKGTLPHYQ